MLSSLLPSGIPKEQKNKERTDELKTIDEEQGNIFLWNSALGSNSMIYDTKTVLS